MTTALLERDAEHSQLMAAVAAARAGAGSLVVVEGAAGGGKSALLAAASRSAARSGSRVLTARGSEIEREFAFGVVRGLFETPVREATGADRASLLAGAAAAASWAVQPDAGEDATDAGPEAGFAVLHGIYWLASNLAQRAPLLLAVDDLHWVDPASVRALAYLAGRIGDLPIALVVALRPDEPGAPTELLDALVAQPEAVRLRLRPLHEESVAAIVRASLPEADDALCVACARASAGNPFLLGELLRTVVRDAAGRDPLDAVRRAAIPDVGDRVLRRVAGLGPEAVSLSRAMAVLDGGALADAAAIAGLDEARAAVVAQRMTRIEILERADPFSFVHPLVRHSLYDGLSVVERDTAHTAAAARLEEAGHAREAVAAHLAATRPARSAHVAATLAGAAADAVARAAPESAVHWLRRALEEGAPEPPRAVLLHELGGAEVLARDPAALPHLREALADAQDPHLAARIARDLTEVLFATGRWGDGVATASRALAALGDRDPDLALGIEMLRATMRAQDPRLVADFDRDRERLVGLASGTTWGARALAVLLATVQAARGEHLDDVRAVLERERYDGTPLDGRIAGTWATAHVWALVLVDEDAGARAVVDALAAHARESPAVAGALVLVGLRGWLDAREGALKSAEAAVRPGIELSLRAGAPLNTAVSFWFVVDALLECASLDDLGDVLESFPIDPDFAPTWGGAMLLETRGRLRLMRGDRAGAVADLRANAATNAALRRGPLHSPWRSALALALPAAGLEEAQALVSEELHMAAASGLPRPHGIALRAHALLAAGGTGIEALEASIALLERTPARLELARSRVELGAALRRSGRRADAREPLAAGRELAYACGADRLVARAGDELRAAGARPRRIARTGVDALTASELRAARLVAQGRSNAEVAQELFVSLKTVETHLSSAYAKLGLAGPGARRRVAAALGDG